MKTITKRDYEEIVFLKNISDHLQEEREELYQRVKKILYVTDDNSSHPIVTGKQIGRAHV